VPDKQENDIGKTGQKDPPLLDGAERFSAEIRRRLWNLLLLTVLVFEVVLWFGLSQLVLGPLLAISILVVMVLAGVGLSIFKLVKALFENDILKLISHMMTTLTCTYILLFGVGVALYPACMAVRETWNREHQCILRIVPGLTLYQGLTVGKGEKGVDFALSVSKVEKLDGAESVYAGTQGEYLPALTWVANTINVPSWIVDFFSLGKEKRESDQNILVTLRGSSNSPETRTNLEQIVADLNRSPHYIDASHFKPGDTVRIMLTKNKELLAEEEVVLDNDKIKTVVLEKRDVVP
jgi:hypothetical protein